MGLELESSLDGFGRGPASSGLDVERTQNLLRGLGEHVPRLSSSAEGARPVVLPSYGATRSRPYPTALVALLLRRYGVPVVVHGALAADGTTTLSVLRHLGIAPVADLAQAQAQLARENLAYIALDLLAPALAHALGRADSTGRGASLRALASLLDPFGGDGYRVIGAPRGQLPWLRAVLSATRADALLFAAGDGEPFVEAVARPELESFVGGVRSVSTLEPYAAEPEEPAAFDAASTAAAVIQAVAGERPVPAEILAQLACCLEGARRSR